MECLYCGRETYYEPYSNIIYVKDNNARIYYCINCRAQFTADKNGKIEHISFSIKIKDRFYYIGQYLPSSLRKGNIIVITGGKKIISVDFIENLSPINAEKKLKFWLMFS